MGSRSNVLRVVINDSIIIIIIIIIRCRLILIYSLFSFLFYLSYPLLLCIIKEKDILSIL